MKIIILNIICNTKVKLLVIVVAVNCGIFLLGCKSNSPGFQTISNDLRRETAAISIEEPNSIDTLSVDEYPVVVDSNTGIPEYIEDNDVADSYPMEEYPSESSPIELPQNVVPENENKKSGVLGYSFPRKMKRNETKNINVFVSINHKGTLVIDTLRKIVESQSSTPGTDDEVIKFDTQNILFYRNLEVILIDPDSSFNIHRIHSNDKQLINLNGANRWRWTIKPIKNNPEALLVLKIIAETPEGTTDDLNDISIPIEIKVESPVRPLWIYLLDNPEFFLSAILIPLAVFLGRKFLLKKEENPAV